MGLYLFMNVPFAFNVLGRLQPGEVRASEHQRRGEHRRLVPHDRQHHPGTSTTTSIYNRFS